MLEAAGLKLRWRPQLGRQRSTLVYTILSRLHAGTLAVHDTHAFHRTGWFRK